MSRQLGQMNTIYNQANVTIIAAAGKSSSYGLPGVGQRPRTIPNKFTLDGTTWKYKPRPFRNHVGASKWSTRGWTYQEAVFSRRCVIFADDQVFYQCGCMTCAEELIQDFANCERVVFPIFERITYEDSDAGIYLPRSWRFMTNLEAYSKRELTYDSDVLRAMEGVFGFYAQLEPSVEQCWGLPLRWVGCELSSLDEHNIYRIARSKHDDVVGALLWAMLWEPAWSEIHIPKTGFAKRNGFPTWSWSGWKVGVRWNFLENVEHLEKSDSFPTRRRSQHWVTKKDYPHEGIWTHFVVQKNIGASERGLVLSLDLTHGGAATSSDLASGTDTINLNPMTLRCIVISYDCGMIVQCSNGISKRVGLLRFEGEFFENGRASKELLAFSTPAAIAPDFPWAN
ncbi:hypothetical protein IWW34DRAFT_789497 [Fusarium oxysporum f. sp. albedinis]|nr:hypothetical protein IWW34DRAFT_789497 [Fusarium oxysporum f. sp. albedinis]